MDNETKINPLGWGILFFTFSLLLITTPGLKEKIQFTNLSLDTAGIHLLFLVSTIFSVLMLLAIIQPIRNKLSTPNIKKWVILFVYDITLLGYFVTFISGISATGGLIQHIVLWFGFLWMVVILLILASATTRRIGVMFSVVLLIAGIVLFFTQSTDIHWMSLIIFVILAILTFVVSLFQPKCLKNIPII